MRRRMIVCFASALALLLLAFRAGVRPRTGWLSAPPVTEVRPEMELLPEARRTGVKQEGRAASEFRPDEGGAPGATSARTSLETEAGDAAVPKVAVERITVHPKTLRLRLGMSDHLTAEIFPPDASDKTVIWQSSYPWVAECNPSGMTARVTAVSVGESLVIVGTRDGGHTAMCTVIATAQFAPDGGCSVGGY